MTLEKENKELTNFAKILTVDNHQNLMVEDKIEELNQVSQSLKQDFNSLSAESDDILNSLNSWIDSKNDINVLVTDNEFENLLLELDELDTKNKVSHIEKLDILKVDNDFSQTLKNVNDYAEKQEIDLSNPYYANLSQLEINNINRMLASKFELSNLDKYDYAFASIVGIIMGLVDAFLVGSITDGNKNSPGQGWLGAKTDTVFEKMVNSYAKFEYNNLDSHKGPRPDFSNPKVSIRWLEKAHKVSYDAANNAHVTEGLVNGMDPSNHHLKSLAHDPSLLGLIIGVLDQLTGKATFINSDGSFVRVVTDNFENGAVTSASSVQKVIRAIVNWFGHIMSDVSGASGAKGRGAGLPALFFELTQVLHFGSFTVNNKEMDVAQLSEWIYKQGLDIRALTAQTIPVLISEVMIRLYWSFKKHFYYGESWQDSMITANSKNSDLQKLLFTTMATFETVDISDAILRNGPTVKSLLSVNFSGLIDLSFRSVQVLRSHYQHVELVDSLNDDLQAEWDRIYQS